MILVSLLRAALTTSRFVATFARVSVLADLYVYLQPVDTRIYIYPWFRLAKLLILLTNLPVPRFF